MGLEEARRRLGLEPRSLQQQWRRSVMLGDTVRLLQDAKSVIDAPQRVQCLELAKVMMRYFLCLVPWARACCWMPSQLRSCNICWCPPRKVSASAVHCALPVADVRCAVRASARFQQEHPANDGAACAGLGGGSVTVDRRLQQTGAPGAVKGVWPCDGGPAFAGGNI